MLPINQNYNFTYLYHRKSEMEYVSTIIKSQTEYGVFNIIESLKEVKSPCIIKRLFRNRVVNMWIRPNNMVPDKIKNVDNMYCTQWKYLCHTDCIWIAWVWLFYITLYYIVFYCFNFDVLWVESLSYITCQWFWHDT